VRAAQARRESGGEHERAGERGEEVQWWPGVLGGLYRGQGRAGKVATGGNRWWSMVLMALMVGHG
jgi:hypothetical protein